MISDWIPTPLTELYFECHITVEPLHIGTNKERTFRDLCLGQRFKVAELLMKKGDGVLEQSSLDTFATSRDKSYVDLHERMCAVIRQCERYGIKVWRYKIENTLLDVKLEH